MSLCATRLTEFHFEVPVLVVVVLVGWGGNRCTVWEVKVSVWPLFTRDQEGGGRDSGHVGGCGVATES